MGVVRACGWLSLCALVACFGTIDDPNLGDPMDGGVMPSDSGTPAVDGGGATIDAGAPTPDADPGQPAWMTMCNRWNADRQTSEGTWTGDVDTCEHGDFSESGRDDTVKLVNLYRYLADLPAIDHEAGRDAMSQECALMMHANGGLSHNPPASWACYTDDGATAAGRSNIATTPGVASIDLYVVDPGNATTLGHRRWILSNGLGPIGVGSTSAYSCLWVIGGSGDGNNAWTAYPPPGPFPFEAVEPTFRSIDETGWSVQSESIDLGGAQVTVTANGQDMPVQVTQLLPNYGSRYAISFLPQGWTTQAGTTYHVEVAGVSPPIEYDVQVVSCN